MSLVWVVLASQLALPPAATQKQRERVLGSFLSPPPGTMLTIPKRVVNARAGDPLLIKGEIWIRPPQGSCLTIRGDARRRDRRYCKKTPISWDIFELDAVGRLNVTITVEGQTDTSFSWPTPYRVANYVPLGGLNSEENVNVPIYRCEASDDGTERKIVLSTMDDRRWFILLPEFDQPLPPMAPPPNLNVKSDMRQEEKPAPKSVLGKLLSGDYRRDAKPEYVFHLSRRNAYEMSSSGFTETGAPQGMQGICRYNFTGAPGDPESGAIECYKTDTFDAIYAHVTCFSQLKPKIQAAP